MALSASIVQTLGLFEHVKVHQRLILRLLHLLLPSLAYFFPELFILHKLLSTFKINLVCSHCHLIPQLGGALGDGHCGHAKISLEDMRNESDKNLYLFFYFYSSIWHVTLLPKREIVKVLGKSFDWLNVARFSPFLANPNDTVCQGIYHVLSRYPPINKYSKTKYRLIEIVNLVNQKTVIFADMRKVWSISFICFTVHVVVNQGHQSFNVQNYRHCIPTCFCELLVNRF